MPAQMESVGKTQQMFLFCVHIQSALARALSPWIEYISHIAHKTSFARSIILSSFFRSRFCYSCCCCWWWLSCCVFRCFSLLLWACHPKSLSFSFRWFPFFIWFFLHNSTDGVTKWMLSLSLFVSSTTKKDFFFCWCCCCLLVHTRFANCLDMYCYDGNRIVRCWPFWFFSLSLSL